MRKLILAAVLAAVVIVSGVAFAGNVHRDGEGIAMPDVFAPIRVRTVTQTKADATYTPTAGTKMIKFQPNAAVTYKINGTGTGYPVAANANEGPFGLATRTGVGTAVTSLAFAGPSSATKTVTILEQ
jgi:hypothetical protein